MSSKPNLVVRAFDVFLLVRVEQLLNVVRFFAAKIINFELIFMKAFKNRRTS